jgi:hypothetical protein
MASEATPSSVWVIETRAFERRPLDRFVAALLAMTEPIS